jgi:hypothetical protein
LRLTDLHRHRFAVLDLPKPPVSSQPSPLVELQAATALMVTNPQLFPEMGNAGGVQRQLFTSPRRKVRCRSRRKAHAQVLAVIAKHSDILTLRDGPTRPDGSCASLTERQIGEETGLAKADPRDPDHHNWTGMRLVREVVRELEEGFHIKRRQPRVQYCSRCDEELPRTKDVCDCGIVRGTETAKTYWRWKSYPAVYTLTKECFYRFGGEALLEALAQYQKDEYERRKNRTPEPIVADIKLAREQQKVFQAVQLAAKRAGLSGDPAKARAHRAEQERQKRERLERLFGKKLE